MSDAGGPLARLRKPEYTGENRCVPCTVVNVAIAVLTCAQLAVWAFLAGYPVAGAAAVTGLLVLSLGSIWLRGYLVPATPTLTERFPDRVLALFGKGSSPSIPRGVTGRAGTTDGATSATDGDTSATDGGVAGGGRLDVVRDGDADVGVEALLAEAGVVGTEGRPTGAVRTAWDARIARESGGQDGYSAHGTRLADRFGLDGAVTVRSLGRGVVARIDGERVGAWESGLALRTDLAAAAVLADRVEAWPTLSPAGRGRLCAAVRARRETCPACGDALSSGPVTIRSCCGSRDAVATECVGCGTRLVESPVGE